jgi:nicotinate-nucleotide--dimethylbenzimidazole phosphoribosyltransferase
VADDPNAARRRSSRRDSDPGPDAASSVPDEALATEVTPLSAPSDPGVDGAPDPEPEATAQDAAEPEPEPAESERAEPTDLVEPEPEPAESEATAQGSAEPEPAEPDGVSSETAPDAAADAAESSDAAESEPAEPAEPDAASDAAKPETAPDGAEPGPGAGPRPEPEPAEVAAAQATTLWDSSEGNPTASLPWLQARSPDDRICPFLRAVASDDHLAFPVESPDAANRCASMHEAVPQSLRQQELVCLTANHVNCPRYLRGAADTATEVPATRVRPKAMMTPAISAALIILALSFGASVVFGLANGGLAMPSHAAASASAASATSVAAGSTATPAATSRTTPTPVATSSAGSTAAPTPAPTPSSSASPAPTQTASSAVTGPTPTPASTRSKLLKPCPNKSNCWIYTVKSGDNLFSIAKYFGVPLSKVKSLNPWTKTESLRAGKKLILPNPTR